MLLEAGYFNTDVTGEGNIAVQNFAKLILYKCGICVTPRGKAEFVNKLFEIGIDDGQEKSSEEDGTEVF